MWYFLIGFCWALGWVYRDTQAQVRLSQTRRISHFEGEDMAWRMWMVALLLLLTWPVVGPLLLVRQYALQSVRDAEDDA